MHWEARFRELAAGQDGLIGIDQLPSIDCDSRHWGRARRNGRWSAPSHRVLSLVGSASTDGQRCRAAVLDAGGRAVLCGESTLAWCGLRGFDLSTVHVTRRRGTTNKPARLARVHRLRDLDDSEICLIRGMPTVTPLRAIWSEASRYANERWHERGLVRIGRLLDDANRLKLVTWAELHQSIDNLQRRGRAGTRLLRELAADRQPGTAPTESRNEDQFEAILAGAGSRPFVRQRLVGGTGPVGRTDHRDPELPVVVEVNSLAFHSLPSDRRADEERYAALVEAGFTVAVIWEDDLWSRQRNVIDTVAEVRRRGRVGEPAVIHSAGCPWPEDPTRIIVGDDQPVTRG